MTDKLAAPPTGMGSMQKPKQRRLGLQISIMGVLVLIAMLSAPALILFLLGSLPTFAAWIGDNTERKTTAYTVGIMNICGIIPFVIEVLPHGHSFTKSGAILQDLYTWLLIYLAAALGWLILSVLPEAVRALLNLRLEQQRQFLEKRRAKLVAEWGEKVTSYNIHTS